MKTRPTLPASFYECRTIAERSAWLQEANRERCEEATARKAADRAADLSDLEFDPVPADDEEWTLNPPARSVEMERGRRSRQRPRPRVSARTLVKNQETVTWYARTPPPPSSPAASRA
jgi:hypothetical protein